MSVCVCEEGTIRSVASENRGLLGIDYLLHEPRLPYARRNITMSITTPIILTQYRILLFFINYGPSNATMNQTIYTMIGDMHPMLMDSLGLNTVGMYFRNYGSSSYLEYTKTGDYSFNLYYNSTDIRSVTIMGIR
ncbi:MAG: hypothetical protein J6Y02_24205 [Pseudobutyrivibrio sp.]|nr:hypothetical protein [Pseudobutyrivibrio sp.]